MSSLIHRLENKAHLLKFLVEKPLQAWTFHEYLTCISLIALPIGILLFYKKNKYGWYILSVIISFFLVFQTYQVFYVTDPKLVNASDYIGLAVFAYAFYFISKNNQLKKLNIPLKTAITVVVVSLICFTGYYVFV